jgi:hypothetical protein
LGEEIRNIVAQLGLISFDYHEVVPTTIQYLLRDFGMGVQSVHGDHHARQILPFQHLAQGIRLIGLLRNPPLRQRDSTPVRNQAYQMHFRPMLRRSTDLFAIHRYPLPVCIRVLRKPSGNAFAVCPDILVQRFYVHSPQGAVQCGGARDVPIPGRQLSQNRLCAHARPLRDRPS